MPNHITNHVTVTSCSEKRRCEVINDILNDEGFFDFNKIIPMPAILKVTESPNTKNPEECEKKTGYSDWYHWVYANWGTKWNAYDQRPQYDCLPIKPWHVSVRGGFFKTTKYRGYTHRINKKRYKKFIAENGVQESIQFQTAWAMPNEIFIALSKMYPDVNFMVKYADEDLGCNCGIISYFDGKVFASNVSKNNREPIECMRYWRQFAFELCHPEANPESYGFNEFWDYVEDDE